MADFYKYHGLGNDYLVIDPQKLTRNINLTKKIVRLICHRNLGVGADGILYGPLIKDKQIHVKVINPDGYEAEISGNGIRIFAQYLYDQAYRTAASFIIHTKSGEIAVEIIDASKHLIKVNMGKFSCCSTKIPATGENRDMINEILQVKGHKLSITCINIGNPHCVVLCDSIDTALLQRLGSSIETHKMFPHRTNVQFMEVTNRKNIRIAIWERSAGYTLASGSSSTAAACAAFLQGLVGRDITVHNPGGHMQVNIVNDTAYLTAPVAKVMQGNFAHDFMQGL